MLRLAKTALTLPSTTLSRTGLFTRPTPLLTVSDKSETYGREVLEKMRAAGLRVEADFRSEKLGAKIRDAQLDLVPYMLVVGPRDAEQGTVSVRDRAEGELGAMPLDACISRLTTEVAEKAVRKTFQTSAGLDGSQASMEY
jgi:threonyl-tRNA synthetase